MLRKVPQIVWITSVLWWGCVCVCLFSNDRQVTYSTSSIYNICIYIFTQTFGVWYNLDATKLSADINAVT